MYFLEGASPNLDLESYITEARALGYPAFVFVSDAFRNGKRWCTGDRPQSLFFFFFESGFSLVYGPEKHQ